MKEGSAALWIAAQLCCFFFALLFDRSRVPPASSTVWMACGLLENLLWLTAYGVARKQSGKRHQWILPLVPLSFLLLLGWHSPFESDPIRYEWDGRALLNGINPWLQAPASTGFAPELVARMNFPDLATIYSPFSILVFSASAWLGDLTSLGFLAVLRVIHFAAAWWALRRLRLGWLWLLHPLLLREGLANAHSDVLFGVALVGFRTVRNPLLATLAACTATLIKLPGLLLALGSQKPLRSLGGAAMLVLCGYGLLRAAAPSAEPASSASLFQFGLHWEANSGWFRWIRDGLLDWTPSISFEHASLVSRVTTGLLFLASVPVLLKKSSQPLFWVFFLLPWLSPVSNSWYYLWSFFLLAVSSQASLAHLALFALLPLGDAHWLHQYILAPEHWPLTTWLRDEWGAATLWNVEHLAVTLTLLALWRRPAHFRSFNDQS